MQGGSTYERVRATIADSLGIEADPIQADTSMESLGMDSLGALELMFKLEEEFKISVPTERASEFSTVQAITDAVDSLLNAAAASA
jgi:acyl carrier protein